MSIPSHIRQRVRAAAHARFVGRTFAGDRVYVNRLRALGPENLDAIKLYTPEDAGGRRALGKGGAQVRGIGLRIECLAADIGDDDAVDRADLLAAEVEALVEEDPTLGGAVADTEFEGAQLTEDSEGKTPVVTIVLLFRVTAFSSGAQIPGGRLGALIVGDDPGTAVGRLLSWEAQVEGEPPATAHSLAEWVTRGDRFLKDWSATFTMIRDDADDGQMLLAVRAKRRLRIFPRGTEQGAPELSGEAIVVSVSEGFDESGEAVRTVVVSGNGALS